MFNKQLKANIKKLDEGIAVLIDKIQEEENEAAVMVLKIRLDELVKMRCELATSKANDSYSKEIVSGLVSVVGMVLVLKHEKTDIITSKAFSMATKLFRG